MITYGKDGSLVARRKALAFLHNDKDVTSKVFNELAKTYETRNGGYTRIIKLKERRGDDTPRSKIRISLINETTSQLISCFFDVIQKVLRL